MIRPWEEPPKHYTIYNKRYNETYQCVRETMNDTTKWKRGDIIKFNSGYYEREFYDWRDWFLTQKGKTKYWRRNLSIPKYVVNQYAIIMCRYRVTRNKSRHTQQTVFRDYGSHIMLISGKKIGKLKRLYATVPFTCVSSFPYVGLPENVKKIFCKFNTVNTPNELHSKYGNTLEARTLFIENLQNKISEVSI